MRGSITRTTSECHTGSQNRRPDSDTTYLCIHQREDCPQNVLRSYPTHLLNRTQASRGNIVITGPSMRTNNNEYIVFCVYLGSWLPWPAVMSGELKRAGRTLCAGDYPSKCQNICLWYTKYMLYVIILRTDIWVYVWYFIYAWFYRYSTVVCTQRG